MRLLALGRISHWTEASTAEENQPAACRKYAKDHGHTVVAEAFDSDVSGGMPIRERPEAGPWLTDPAKIAQYDAIVVRKINRLGRDMFDFIDFIRWAAENGKTVYSVAENISLDSLTGILIAVILSVLAQGEREAIQEQVANAREFMRLEGRYGWGTCRYGYKPVRRENGSGLILAVDEEQAAIIHEIIDRVLDGELLGTICADLDRRNVDTPAIARMKRRIEERPDNCARAKKYLERREGKAQWDVGATANMLKSPGLLGYVMYEFKYKNEAGKEIKETRMLFHPDKKKFVKQGPELIDEETHRKVVNVLNARAAKRGTPRKRVTDASLLLDVAFCECGAKMTSSMSGDMKRRQRVYRCALTGKKRGHGSVMINAEQAEQHIADEFMRIVGDLEVVHYEEDPGENHDAEIERIGATLKGLRTDRYERGLIEEDDVDSIREWEELFRSLTERRKHLRSLPTRPAGYREIKSGYTYGELWGLGTKQERRKMMLDAGLRAVVTPANGVRRFKAERIMLTLGEPTTAYAYAPDPDVNMLSESDRESQQAVDVHETDTEQARVQHEETSTDQSYMDTTSRRKGSPMGSYIMRVRQDTDDYVLWSTVTDQPEFRGTRELIAAFLRADENISARNALDRADTKGTSSLFGNGAWDSPSILATAGDQFGDLKRACLAVYCELMLSGQEDQAARLLIPDDSEVAV